MQCKKPTLASKVPTHTLQHKRRQSVLGEAGSEGGCADLIHSAQFQSSCQSCPGRSWVIFIKMHPTGVFAVFPTNKKGLIRAARALEDVWLPLYRASDAPGRVGHALARKSATPCLAHLLCDCRCACIWRHSPWQRGLRLRSRCLAAPPHCRID